MGEGPGNPSKIGLPPNISRMRDMTQSCPDIYFKTTGNLMRCVVFTTPAGKYGCQNRGT
jgi:hypothetical protein